MFYYVTDNFLRAREKLYEAQYTSNVDTHDSANEDENDVGTNAAPSISATSEVSKEKTSWWKKEAKKVRKSGERVTGLFNTDIPTYLIKYTKIFFGVILMSNLIRSIA